MPSIGIHLLVLDEVTAALKDGSSTDREHARILLEAPAFAALGALGPDLGFFMGVAPRAVHALATIFGWSRDVVRVFSDIDGLSDLTPNLAGLLQQLTGTVEGLLLVAQSTIIDSLSELASVFHGPLVAPDGIQQGKPEEHWEWGNLFHWRVTSPLVAGVMREAATQNKIGWQAYALGYLTHIGTDVTGHPYTNQVVGGPARAWGTRHHVAENFMDAHAWWTAHGKDICGAQLHKRFEGLRSDEIHDFAKMLHNEVLQFSHNSLNSSNELPREPTQEAIEAAIASMVGLIKLVTQTGYLSPPIPPKIVIPPLPGQAGSLVNKAAGLIPSRNTSWSIWDYLKAGFVSVLLGLSLAADILRLAIDTALGIGTYPIQVALYLAQKSLYQVYRNVHSLLVLTGIAFPFHDECSSSLGQQFLPTSRPDPHYPHQAPVIESFAEQVQIGIRLLTINRSNYYYLEYPHTPLEAPRTLSSPYVNVLPEYFMSIAERDPVYMKAWRDVEKWDPSALDRLNEQLGRTPLTYSPRHQSVNALGNARELALSLIRGELDLRSFNLDADRGYGYYCWISKGGLPSSVTDPAWYKGRNV